MRFSWYSWKSLSFTYDTESLAQAFKFTQPVEKIIASRKAAHLNLVQDSFYTVFQNTSDKTPQYDRDGKTFSIKDGEDQVRYTVPIIENTEEWSKDFTNYVFQAVRHVPQIDLKFFRPGWAPDFEKGKDKFMPDCAGICAMADMTITADDIGNAESIALTGKIMAEFSYQSAHFNQLWKLYAAQEAPHI